MSDDNVQPSSRKQILVTQEVIEKAWCAWMVAATTNATRTTITTT
jgi:hypothetical protein